MSAGMRLPDRQFNEANTSGGRIVCTGLLIRWPAIYPSKVPPHGFDIVLVAPMVKLHLM
jgi:hypothetical protein